VVVMYHSQIDVEIPLICGIVIDDTTIQCNQSTSRYGLGNNVTFRIIQPYIASPSAASLTCSYVAPVITSMVGPPMLSGSSQITFIGSNFGNVTSNHYSYSVYDTQAPYYTSGIIRGGCTWQAPDHVSCRLVGFRIIGTVSWILYVSNQASVVPYATPWAYQTTIPLKIDFPGTTIETTGGESITLMGPLLDNTTSILCNGVFLTTWTLSLPYIIIAQTMPGSGGPFYCLVNTAQLTTLSQTTL
jgi:hypothetical protein